MDINHTQCTLPGLGYVDIAGCCSLFERSIPLRLRLRARPKFNSLLLPPTYLPIRSSVRLPSFRSLPQFSQISSLLLLSGLSIIPSKEIARSSSSFSSRRARRVAAGAEGTKEGRKKRIATTSIWGTIWKEADGWRADRIRISKRRVRAKHVSSSDERERTNFCRRRKIPQ